MEPVSSADKLDFALRAVGRMPLPAQSWRIERRPWRGEVWATGDDRASHIAAGAAAFVLAVVLRAQGCAVAVELLPRPDQPALIATVKITGGRTPTAEDRRLAVGIDALGGTAVSHPLTGDDRRSMERAAAVEGARLEFPDSAQARLSTVRDGAFAQVVAGLALARVLLTAATRGVRLHWTSDAPAGPVQATLAVAAAPVSP